jgi:hypothetical protein
MLRKFSGWAMFFLILVLAGISFAVFRSRLEPREALSEFYAQARDQETAEDQLICPLILAGKPVCLALMADVTKRNLPLRRYALSAIGSLGCDASVPLLVGIIRDDTEIWYFRSDALDALWLINSELGKKEASHWLTRVDPLADVARRRLSGEAPWRLSYWRAVLCSHF